MNTKTCPMCATEKPLTELTRLSTTRFGATGGDGGVATGVKTSLKGFRIDKNGKLVRNTKKLSVSKQIAQRKSKKVSVKRRSP